MKIYCMSDIHGCLAKFEDALSLVQEHMEEPDTMLCLLDDYIHGGTYNYGVLYRIMNLQKKYGTDKVVALMGNHEVFVLFCNSSIDHMLRPRVTGCDCGQEDEKYLQWMERLPRYYTKGNTIFVHAGINEEAGALWKWETGDSTFVGKYPAEIGKIDGLDMKVVAGHVSTAEIPGNPEFYDIYFDGESHYYIDGTVLESGSIPVLLVDTEADKYYRVTENGNYLIAPYEEEI